MGGGGGEKTQWLPPFCIAHCIIIHIYIYIYNNYECVPMLLYTIYNIHSLPREFFSIL